MARIETAGSEPLLTPAETGERFRVNAVTVNRWADAGKLHAVRTAGGRRRYFASEVDALLRGEVWVPPAWLEAA